MRSARGRLAGGDGEAGLTLVELLVASAMAVVVVGAVGTMLVSAMRNQPDASGRAQNISSARWVLERLTREIRNGIAVDQASPSSVSFRTYVRRTSCGAGGTLASESPAIECEVTYTCTTTACSRIEAAPGIYTGTATTIFSGLGSSQVFCYVPSTNADPTSCGPVDEENINDTAHIGVTLRLPNPSGPAAITISDGASLRNATLAN
jgi:type II secretory pathway pseudopilin PulG